MLCPFFFLQTTPWELRRGGATTRDGNKRGCCAFGCFKVGGSAFWTLWASLVFLNLVVCGFCSLSSAFQSPTQGTTACHQALWGQSSLFKGFFPLLSKQKRSAHPSSPGSVFAHTQVALATTFKHVVAIGSLNAFFFFLSVTFATPAS